MGRARAAYTIRGDPVLAEVAEQGQALAASFAATLGELQFNPRDPSLGARPFKLSAAAREAFTVPFAASPKVLLLYTIDEGTRTIDLVQVIWPL